MEFKSLFEAVIEGEAEKAREIALDLVDKNHKAKDIIEQALIPSMDHIGERFKNDEIFVPEMLVAAEAMKEAMTVLEPLLSASDKSQKTKFVIGTVEGDLHDIGKNLVAMMLEGSGFEVIDLGVGVTAETFVKKIQEVGAPILGMSALLTTTMPRMAETIKALESANLRDKVKIMVGGAPVTEEFCKEINADGFAHDASTAVDVARKLLQ